MQRAVRHRARLAASGFMATAGVGRGESLLERALDLRAQGGGRRSRLPAAAERPDRFRHATGLGALDLWIAAVAAQAGRCLGLVIWSLGALDAQAAAIAADHLDVVPSRLAALLDDTAAAVHDHAAAVAGNNLTAAIATNDDAAAVASGYDALAALRPADGLGAVVGWHFGGRSPVTLAPRVAAAARSRLGCGFADLLAGGGVLLRGRLLHALLRGLLRWRGVLRFLRSRRRALGGRGREQLDHLVMECDGAVSWRPLRLLVPPRRRDRGLRRVGLRSRRRRPAVRGSLICESDRADQQASASEIDRGQIVLHDTSSPADQRCAAGDVPGSRCSDGSVPGVRGTSVPLEELHRALVLFSRRARLERAKIAAPPGPRIDLARVKPITAGLELADHCRLHALSLFASSWRNAVTMPSITSAAVSNIALNCGSSTCLMSARR